MSADFVFTGVDELASELVRMNVKKSEQNAILKQAIQPVADAASQIIPRSNVYRGPTAKNSWRTGQHAADNVVVESASGVVGITMKGGLQDGPYFYERFGEFGTVRESARGWIQAAGTASTAEVLSILGSKLKERIERG